MENIGQLTTEEVNHNQVTLVVPSTGDATRLREFTEKVKQIFTARALGIMGSWKETVVTLETDKPITTADMVNKLMNMPGVERVEESQSMKKRGKPKGILVILAS